MSSEPSQRSERHAPLAQPRRMAGTPESGTGCQRLCGKRVQRATTHDTCGRVGCRGRRGGRKLGHRAVRVAGRRRTRTVRSLQLHLPSRRMAGPESGKALQRAQIVRVGSDNVAWLCEFTRECPLDGRQSARTIRTGKPIRAGRRALGRAAWERSIRLHPRTAPGPRLCLGRGTASSRCARRQERKAWQPRARARRTGAAVLVRHRPAQERV